MQRAGGHAEPIQTQTPSGPLDMNAANQGGTDLGALIACQQEQGKQATESSAWVSQSQTHPV